MTAVEIAIKNGEKMHGEYTVKAIDPKELPGQFYVQNIKDVKRCYIVNITPGRERCQCEQWKRTQNCKHEYFVHETNRIEEGAEIAEARADTSEKCSGW